MATDRNPHAFMKCDGVFDYSAHHRYTVALHNNHDSYTGLRRIAGKRKLCSFNSRTYDLCATETCVVICRWSELVVVACRADRLRKLQALHGVTGDKFWRNAPTWKWRLCGFMWVGDLSLNAACGDAARSPCQLNVYSNRREQCLQQLAKRLAD